MPWRDRTRTFFLMHPRANALAIVLMAVSVPAIDSGRLVVASSQSHIVWRTALGVGIAVGLLSLLVLVGTYHSLRAMGSNAVKYGAYAGVVLFLLVFGATHPRHGPDGIGTWGAYMFLVSIDTCMSIALLGFAVLVWRRPVPDLEHDAHPRRRHGPRWKRRSAARRKPRPGGR